MRAAGCLTAIRRRVLIHLRKSRFGEVEVLSHLLNRDTVSLQTVRHEGEGSSANTSPIDAALFASDWVGFPYETGINLGAAVRD